MIDIARLRQYLGELTNILSRDDTILIVISIRKVHQFLGYSQRLVDVRGRNGFLIVLRKLVASVLSRYLERYGCRAYVLRCGGNAIYVAGTNCGDIINKYLNVFHSDVVSLINIVSHMLIPAEVSLKIFRGGSNGLQQLYSYTATGFAEIYGGGYIGSRDGFSATPSKLYCSICGAYTQGFSLHDANSIGNKLVAHVIREEESLCIKDILFRLIGRVLNSPIVIGIILPNLTNIPSTTLRDTAIAYFKSDDPGYAELIVKVYRHQETSIDSKLFLDDATLIGITIGSSDHRVSIAYALIGFAKGLNIYQVSKREDVYSVLKEIDSIYNRYVEDVTKILDILVRNRDRVDDRIYELVTAIYSCIQRGLSSGYVPYLYPDTLQQNPVLDHEIFYINAKGDLKILDIETLASVSDSGTIAIIQSDGDNFGTLTNPFKLINRVKEIRNSMENMFSNLLHLDVDEERNPLTYIWDYAIEYIMMHILKKSLAISYLSPLRMLIVYIGGDENLFISTLTGRRPEERLSNLFEHIKRFRGLVIDMAIKALQIVMREDTEGIRDILKRYKISTLSSVAIIIHPKFPLYVAMKILSSVLDQVKNVARDSIAVFSLDSIVYPEPSEQWFVEPIVILIPNTVLEQDNIIRNSFTEYLNRSELIDVFAKVYSYCLLEKRNIRCVIDTLDKILDIVYDELGMVATKRLVRYIIANTQYIVSSPRYGVFNTFKNIERGL
ncbi:hypothetical protein Igag_0619 [Ignisphaera aggregans DSM 17230]|uniref:Uncharacterized protein n=1 Tax=Ignisphaera aggregans (strain DSM 17230 / JCM 13409 / AQ1.S1) TaxID=583356 RepID=E0SSI1_IGNAA|nr:hypothetical protein Igag_0619 [Ignisphaera aggregans DSM 17230]